MTSITKTWLFNDKSKLEINRLSLPDLLSIADTIQAEREQLARDIAKQEKLDKYEMLQLVLEVRRHKTTMAEVLDSTNTPKGAIDIIKKSLDKTKIDKNVQEKLLAEGNIPSLVELAKMLVLDLTDVFTEEKEVEVQPEPKGPLAENPTPCTVSTDQVQTVETVQEKKVAEALENIATFKKPTT